jgi:sugar lactone lactonase YvrE
MNRQRCRNPRIGTAVFCLGRALLLVAMALFSVAAINAQATFSGTQIALDAGVLAAPTGVASDGSGNIFIADRGNNRVVELSPSSSGFGAPVTILSELSGPAGVAADWTGNVYVADTGNGRILMLPIAASGFGSPVTLATGLSTPSGVAVDSGGNIYVAVSGSNCVMEVPSTAGAYGAPIVVATGFSNPLGVAVDAAETLYVADTGNKRVAKEPLSAGGYTASAYIGGTGVTPVAVYVDKNYNLFFVDSVSERLIEASWEAVANRYNGEVALGSGFASPAGVVTDPGGNVYVADSANDEVVKLVAASVPFGSVGVGSSASPLIYNFSISAGTTLGAIGVVSQGVSGKDFVDTGQSSCAVKTYTSATICGVSVIFEPLGSGTRIGAIVLSDSSGNPLASTFTSGAGEEPQIAFVPGATMTLGSQLSGPEGVAVDGNGDIFIADTGNNRIVEIPWTGSGYGQQATVPVTGLSSPMGLAVDGAGNLYIASNGNAEVVRLAWTGASFGSQSKVGTGLNTPAAVAADTTGNLYFTDTINERVNKVPWTGTGFAAEIALGNSHWSPTGIAVSENGNVFFSDPYQYNVSEVAWTGSAYLGQNNLPNLVVSFPSALAVDGNSNLYVLDAVRNQVVMLPWLGTGFGPQVTVATGFNAPYGLAADSNGNLYVADTGNNRIVKIELSAPAVQNFDNTFLGTTSQDSAHLVRIENIGNQPLVIDSLTFPVDFPESAATANACVSNISLGPGLACEVTIDFTPQSVGSPLNEAVDIVDNSLGVTGAQHILPLSGSSLARSPQTITLPSVPSVVYGVARFFVAATSSSGLPVTLSVISGPGTISHGDELTVTGAGRIVLQANQAGNTAFSPAPEVQMSIQVTQAVLTVMPVNVTCAYRSIPTSFRYSVAGYVRGDTLSSAVTGQAIVSSTAISTSDAGTYPLTVAQGTLAAVNYTFVFLSGTLIVNKVSIQVQAVSFSRTYGGPMPALTWKMSGFLSGDSQSVVAGVPVLTTIANSGSPVGVYAISVSVATLSAANYAFTAINGSITVNPAVLTVAPSKVFVTYGAAIPPLSYTISGVMNGDTLSSAISGQPVLTTAANSLSAAGTYSIQASLGTLVAENYRFAFAASVLTINKAIIVVTAGNVSSTYGSNIPALPYSMIGFLNGDTAATAVQGWPSMNVAANAKSVPGSYIIVPSLGSLNSKNYAFDFVNGVLTIGKSALTVTPTAPSMTYGGKLPTLAYTYSGFVNGDSNAALTGAPKIATTATSASSAGKYPINVSVGTLASKNYSFLFVAGTLTVNKAPLIVKANALSVRIASPLPPLTYTVSGLVNEDTLASATTGAPALSTTADTTKSGAYGITITAGTLAASNYQLSFENGTLTVNAPQALYRVAISMVSSDSEYGARSTPRSVMMAVTYFAGVTSKAGLQMPTPCGVSCLPPWWVTSTALRSSIGMASPVAVARSIVDHGAAT